MTHLFNFILAAAIVILAVLIIYYIFKRDSELEKVEEDAFTITELAGHINNSINNYLKTNIADLGLNETETKKREQLKIKLSKAWRNCSFGDVGEKEYVKDYIKDLLQKYFKIKEATIDQVIAFDAPDSLSAQDKGEILLYVYKCSREYGGKAFVKMCEENYIDIEKEYEDGIHYEITREDIRRAYQAISPELSFMDKLEIVAQRIYQTSRGLGVIDELRDQSCLDGISGGVSGLLSENYNYLDEAISDNTKQSMLRQDSVWVILQGRPIHLSYLSFDSKRELERICKNIYRYDAPYYLSGIKGKVLAEDKKGNRITVSRPPFSDSWKFSVRKFESIQYAIEELIRDEGCEIIIDFMKYIIMGCMVIVITGNVGTGKTTMLKALVKFIDPTLSIGMEEEVFEAWLNKLYPRRNINSYRKTDFISIEEGFDFQKKADRDVMIMGEVSEQKHAALIFQLSQFTRMTICTNHSSETKKLIEYFRNAGLVSNIFSSEQEAEEQVASALQWDIHMKRDKDGHRYIERITEIIPNENYCLLDGLSTEDIWKLYLKKNIEKRYQTRDIIRFENGRYVAKSIISDRSLAKIQENLSGQDLQQFENFYHKYFTDIASEELYA